MVLTDSARASAGSTPVAAARAASRRSMRGVSMRPGSRVLTVTPLAATSPARVLAQAATEARRVLDTPRVPTGSITVMEATFRMRPQPMARIPGNTRSVRRKTDSTMDSK